MTYRTAAEDAKAIRARLKAELGLTAKDVSVRKSDYSMGSSIRTVVKTRKAWEVEEAIEAIAKEVAESIRRCEYSGDILSGGNRFVFSEVSSSLKEEIGAEVNSLLGLSAMTEGSGSIYYDGLVEVRIDLGGEWAIYPMTPDDVSLPSRTGMDSRWFKATEAGYAVARMARDVLNESARVYAWAFPSPAGWESTE